MALFPDFLGTFLLKHPFLTFIVVILLSALILVYYILYLLTGGLIRPHFSPALNLPGPKSPSYLWGNVKTIRDLLPGQAHHEWYEQYGDVFAYKGFFGTNRICTHDVRALQYVLNHGEEFTKPEEVRNTLKKLGGEGLIWAEGAVHKRQRRVVLNAFNNNNVRQLTEVIWEKALELRDVWFSRIGKSAAAARASVDGLDWIAKLTFDIMGLTGFGFDFNYINIDNLDAEEQDADELVKAIKQAVESGDNPSFLAFIGAMLPRSKMLLRLKEKIAAEAHDTMHALGLKLLQEKKEEILKLGPNEEQRSDLCSLLVRANMSPDVPESLRLSDEDVVAQIPTFLIAGHETTTTTVAWALYIIATNPEIQNKIRREIITSLPGSSMSAVPFTPFTPFSPFHGRESHPEFEALNDHPYLDAFIKEVLRLYPALPVSRRVATKDCVIPLSPEFPGIKCKDGSIAHQIRVQKGDGIDIATASINLSRTFFGEDAAEFKPERWLGAKGEKLHTMLPSIMPNIMTFLGGSRACVGYKFAMAEIKIVIYTIIRNFRIEFPDPNMEIIRKNDAIVARPLVKGQQGNQLPLRIRRV
ncbi:cytochrome P450 [Sistotremastrum niveocremeum HHB9708]|uniref:Cytochrome P450 n=1 Tax=Sistotremastrum niveocremeum HHB9708 TaxID=1314777 RepID=A0A164Y5Y1_9AGAM|nr:cytochrome P450 [Sistotremastrum niveocremeum HHB9708]